MPGDLRELPDAELMRTLKELVDDEQRRTVLVLRHLAEMDRRRLALKEGYPSLFEYCRRELRYAEGEAVRRIRAARAGARFPIMLRAIDRGLLSLTTVSMLAPHLTWENHRSLIRSALGRGKREVEKLIAALEPSPEPAERVRFVSVAPREAAMEAAVPSVPGQGSSPSESAAPSETGLDPSNTGSAASSRSPAPPEAGAPSPALPATRVHFSFTADEALLASVEHAKGLLRHRFPFGGLEEVFTAAVEVLLEKIDPGRRSPKSEAARPPLEAASAGARSRRIPGGLKALVWRRDGGRCAFVSRGGRRCGSADGLELDHIRPWALGGLTEADNLRLLCRAHNDLQARLEFGDDAVDAHRRGSCSVR